MTFKINLAGQIRDIAGESVQIPKEINETGNLIKYISEKYPAIQNYMLKISVDGELVTTNKKFNRNSTILVFTPFAGG